MARRNRTCSKCGTQYSYEIGRGTDSRYCGDDCRGLAASDAAIARAALLPECSVEWCGSPANRSKRTLCEKHYYQIRRTGSILVPRCDAKPDVLVEPRQEREAFDSCQYCGVPTSGNKWCSGRCSTRAQRGVAVTTDCRHCGIVFEPLNGVVCCSKECKSEMLRAWNREYFRKRVKIDPVFRAAVRANGHKRRASKANAFVEHVDRDLIMARDKWVCHLCHERIPKAAKWPDGRYGTLEHVIPLVAGGMHSYENIKAAHLSCNCKKGAKTIGQLGFVFADAVLVARNQPRSTV